MAVNFLNNLDLNGNQLLNARLQVLASDPGSAVAGDIIYNSTSNLFKFYNGSDWVDPSAGTYTGWTITGDSGTTANVTSGAGVVFVGGLGMTTTSNGFNITTDLDEATATTRGGIELFSNTDQSVAANTVSATAGRTYGLQLNSAGQGVINVPWTDNSGAEFTFIASSGSDSTVTSGGSVTFAQGSGITTTNDGSGTITIAATGAGTMSSFILAGGTGTSQTISDGNTVTINGGTLISTVAGATDKVNINHDSVTRNDTTATSTLAFGGTFNAIDLVTSSTQGHITAGNTRTFTMPAAPADTTYDFNATALAANVLRLNLDASGSGTDSSVTVSSNTTGNIALVRTSATAVTVGLTDDITLVGDLTVGGGDITLSGTGRIQGVDTVTAATDAASKAYVDSVLVGNLVFQGGYNAATNTPDLDSSPSASIKKGWAYVVTAAGDFFTERVEIGDFLFAQDDSPTALSDWVTVQNNVSLATVSNVGIGNVNIDGAGLKDGLSLAYSAGTATVGLDISSLPASGDVSTLDPTNVYFAVEDEDNTANQKITLAQIQQGISPSAVASLTAASTVVTHNLGTRDVIVQLYDTVTYDTVYADVSRTSTNTITVAFASTPANTIKCMIYSTEIQGV